MRKYAKKPESPSRTLDSNPKASRQAPISEILQEYRNSPFRCLPTQRTAIKDDMQLEEVTQMDEKAICQKNMNPIQLQAGDQTNAVIQLGGGRGNHVYNDFVAHFHKYWMSYLKEIIEKFGLDKTWWDELTKVLGTYQSSFREYTFSGAELFDGDSVTTGGANATIFSDILSIIDNLFKRGRKFHPMVCPENMYNYEKLLATLIHFYDNIEYYVIDHEIKLAERDSEITDIFKTLLQITIDIIRIVCWNLYTSLLKMGDPKDELEGFKGRIAKAKVLLDQEIKKSPPKKDFQTGSRKASQKTPKRKDLSSILTDRKEFHESLEAMSSLLVGEMPEEVKTKVGYLNPDEIRSDGSCFFNSLIALGVEGARNVQELRYLAAEHGGNPAIVDTTRWAESEDITAIANALGIQIEIVVFDLDYKVMDTQCFGSVGPTYHIAQIFGGHFTPLRGVPSSSESSVSASKAEKRE